MISFGNAYFVSSEILSVTDKVSTDPNARYGLVLTLKNGMSYQLNYTTSALRDNARSRLVREIDIDSRSYMETILNKFHIIDSALKSLEKRQLKLLRVLSGKLPPDKLTEE